MIHFSLTNDHHPAVASVAKQIYLAAVLIWVNYPVDTFNQTIAFLVGQITFKDLANSSVSVDDLDGLNALVGICFFIPWLGFAGALFHVVGLNALVGICFFIQKNDKIVTIARVGSVLMPLWAFVFLYKKLMNYYGGGSLNQS